LSDFTQIWIFTKSPISNFTKIHQVGAGQKDAQTDIMKLTGVFRECENTQNELTRRTEYMYVSETILQ